MGYNISDVGGEAVGGGDVWAASLDLSLSNSDTISGDFNVVPLVGGAQSEATNGYVFSALSNPSFGTLSFNTVNGTYEFTPDWSAIQLAPGGNQVVSFTVTGTSGANSDTDTVQIDLLVCVLRGTAIETSKGSVAVEDLTLGDRICTFDGQSKPVRWIGSHKVSLSQMRTTPALRPILISADALGPGKPHRDLMVSPQHRILIEDAQAELLFGETQVLVAAKSLVNDCTIQRVQPKGDVEYFHVLLDDHQIMITEGLPTESFHPGGYVMSSIENAVRAELIGLFPQLASENGFGDTARPTLDVWETQLLARSGHRPVAP